MPRIHLFEWEDQPWFPSFLRDFGTDFLFFLAAKTKMYSPVVPAIEEVLAPMDSKRILDLASGGGGGLLSIYPELKEGVDGLQVTLSDLFPNRKSFDRIGNDYPGIYLEPRPIDARHVPPDLKGLRTMFLSFHHFRPEDARAILQNAVDQKVPIAVFEAQERSLPSLLAMVFSPVTVLLTTPFVRPLRLSRLLFTYIVPVVPLFVLWDGVVSALRTYSVREMEQMIAKLDRDDFQWRVGKMKSGPGHILYTIGKPN